MNIPKGRIREITFCLFLATTNATAQLNLLTTQEALRILDLVPEVAKTWADGGCPSYGVTYETPVVLDVQVRETCLTGGFASNLLDNYVIDRSTGAVAEGLDLDDSSRISTPEIDSITSGLVRQTQARVLKTEEAECLVLEAARSELGVDEPPGTLSVSRIPGPRGEWRFLIERHIPSTSAVAAKFFTVRSDTVNVRDDSTGQEVVSQGLGLLASRMLSIRELPRISVDDALAIVLRVPSLAASVANGCSELVSSGYGTSDERYIGCAGSQIKVVAAVNARTGHVTDPRSHKSLDSPESEQAARDILRRHGQQLDQDRAALATACK